MDVLRIAADDEDLRVGAFTDLGERDEHLMLQAIENPDQSWYRGTVTALRGSPTIEVSILLMMGAQSLRRTSNAFGSSIRISKTV